MRIVVYPHLMEIGGSQLNAIELAAAVQQRGHEVTVFSPQGRLTTVAEDLGLDLVPAPVTGRWPARSNVRALNALVADRRAEVVHGYESGPALEIAYGPSRLGVPMVVTSMSMSVPTLLPRRGALLVGTRELARQQARVRDDVQLMEPPVDTTRYTPPTRSEALAARRLLGIGEDDLVLAVVCRLVDDLGKLDGVLTAIRAMAGLRATSRLRLLVVGEGPGIGAVRAAAHSINARSRFTAVLVPGALEDPLPAYQAADVVLGMGSSALKAMACGRPLVVQGHDGFWRLLDRDSLPQFLESGWWGGHGRGEADLVEALTPLLVSSTRRVELGRLAREVASSHYSLGTAAEQLERLYERLLGTTQPGRDDLLRTGVELGKFTMARWLQVHVPAAWDAWNVARGRALA